MKKNNSQIYYIFIFVTAQIIWFSLLGLWIYWYVTNYLLFQRVEDQLAPQMIPGVTNIVALVSGLVLLVMLSFSMSVIFIYLTRQMNVTRQYDNFIANVTHELKSPLSSIQLYLETMQRRDVPRERQQEFFRLMLGDTRRLNHLINTILHLSALEQRKLARKVAHDYHVYEADVVIRQVLDEALEELKFPAENVQVKGRVKGQCVIDRQWLKIVFSNLIDNARKYSRRQPEIRVRLEPGDRYFHIHFTDNGIGIAARDQKKVFHKFQRIYNSESPNVKGTGLGLYWVREIVRYHGGKIALHSAGLDHGTTFNIALPIYRESRKHYINRLLRLSKKYATNTEGTHEKRKPESASHSAGGG